jgi:putative peptidoglycan lipid II flippase
MAPAVLGASVYQISNLVDTLLASLLPEGSVSYLYYADRLVQFPLGVFAIALATAVLPSLSRQAALEDTEGLRTSFLYAMNLVFFITIPATLGLMVLREPIVQLLFERGAFDRQTTVMTAEALLYYAVGLWAVSGGRILTSTFYSLQDTETPVKIAVLSLLTKIALSVLLMGPMRHGGLALATSLASGVNLLLLMGALKKRLGRIGARVILRSVVKSMGSGIIMAIVVVLAGRAFFQGGDAGFLALLIWVLGAAAGGTLVYFLFAFLFRSSEAVAAMGLLNRLRGRISRSLLRG